MNVGRNGGWHLARASSAITGGNRDVLLAIDAVRDRKTLNRGSEAGVEKDLARVHIDGFEMAGPGFPQKEAPRGWLRKREGRMAPVRGTQVFPPFFVPSR